MRKIAVYTLVAVLLLATVSSIQLRPAHAITVTQTTDINDLKNALFGGGGAGIDLSTVSIELQGEPEQFGTFVNPTGTYGIGDGIVLSTGNVNDYNDGPNLSSDKTTPYGVSATAEQEALLDPITGGSFDHFDVAVMKIKFNMLPGFDKIFFNVTFGSEEYPEYVGSIYIDGFGLYVNGNNIAFVNNAPVNINHPYMVAVSGTELDGILGGSAGQFGAYVHTFSAPVNPTDNELIFIVADTSDTLLDTTVYISQLGGSPPPPPGYNLALLEDGNPSDGVITLGEDITAKASTDDPDVDNVTFTWIRPDSSIARTQNVTLSGGAAYDTFVPDMLGTWIVRADFNNGVTLVTTLNITFQVIPESIIGAIAPVATGLAAFIVYRYYRSGRSRQ